jgi:hypothetical protein
MVRSGHSGRETPGLVSNPEVKPAALGVLWGPRGPAARLSWIGLPYHIVLEVRFKLN